MILPKDFKLDKDQILKLVKNLPQEDQADIVKEVNLKTSHKIENDEVLVDFFGGNRMAGQIDKLMHAADLYESGKIFACYDSVVVVGKPDLNALCKHYKAAWEETGGYVVFVGIRSINNVRGKGYPLYFKEEIQSLSMVRKGDLCWVLFKDALEALGYEVETDKSMHVTKVL